jgi:hypothetical protein
MPKINIIEEVKEYPWVFLAGAIILGILVFALTTGGFMS